VWALGSGHAVSGQWALNEWRGREGTLCVPSTLTIGVPSWYERKSSQVKSSQVKSTLTIGVPS
jgi:hypothetical protein